MIFKNFDLVLDYSYIFPSLTIAYNYAQFQNNLTPNGKNTCFIQLVWHKSAFAAKFSAQVWQKWMITSEILVHHQRKWIIAMYHQMYRSSPY